MTANRIIFGITGGSGSGKSYVSDIFRRHGVRVIDADEISRVVTEPQSRACGEIRRHFGDGVFDVDGRLLRKKLGSIVFSDPHELLILNRITHKYIKEEIILRLASAGERAAAIDGAVIIGSPIEKMCEFLVGVYAPEQVRIARITARDGISDREALLRIKAQPSDDFYAASCRFLINNDGSQPLDERVREILSQIGFSEENS